MIYNEVTIGKIIKQERKNKGWTQEYLGNKLNIVGKQISNYENGITIPPVEVLFKLCDLFNCELGYILGEPKYTFRTKENTIICSNTGLSLEAVHAICRITGTTKKCIDYGHNSEKYKRILNQVLSSNEFQDIIKTLLELDNLYCKKTESNTKLENFHDEVGEDLFNLSMEYSGIPDGLIDNELNEKEISAINQFNKLIDEDYEISTAVTRESKYNRFLLQEALTLLVNKMYPIVEC